MVSPQSFEKPKGTQKLFIIFTIETKFVKQEEVCVEVSASSVVGKYV